MERWRGCAGQQHPGAAESIGDGPSGRQPPGLPARQFAKGEIAKKTKASSRIKNNALKGKLHLLSNDLRHLSEIDKSRKKNKTTERDYFKFHKSTFKNS